MRSIDVKYRGRHWSAARIPTLLTGLGMLGILGCGESSSTTPDDAAAQPDLAMNQQGNRDLAAPRDMASQGGLDGSGFEANCADTHLESGCGKPQSIVRTVLKLGPGMAETSGSVMVTLAHFRLGEGQTGGVYHFSMNGQGVLSPDKTAQIDLDMCQGGQMWSEENCEFWYWGFLDKNGNGKLDAGEPAGHTLVNLSCHSAGPACVGIVLDCTDGPSCISFNDPGACSCGTPSCPSEFVTCS